MIQQFWNKAVMGEERTLVPRDYAYASELGGAMINRWMKMKGIEPSNKPNGRALRKMMAGNFTEAVVLYIFQRAGILKESQKRFESDWTPISIHGKSDIIIGGRPNIDQARSAAQQFEYFPEMQAISMKVIEGLMDIEYPETLYEVKSIATYKADYFEKMGDNAKPVPTHRLQAGFYAIERELPYSILSYICRDDLRMTEFYIHNEKEIRDEIYNDTLKLKGYLDANQRPPLEPLILLEDGKFSKNFAVEYSDYLTLLYGFEEPRDYSDHVKKDIARWNRVVVRYKNGDKITDKNKEVRDEIELAGYNFEQILANFVEETPEEE
jgi:hypothetical protein